MRGSSSSRDNKQQQQHERANDLKSQFCNLSRKKAVISSSTTTSRGQPGQEPNQTRPRTSATIRRSSSNTATSQSSLSSSTTATSRDATLTWLSNLERTRPDTRTSVLESAAYRMERSFNPLKKHLIATQFVEEDFLYYDDSDEATYTIDTQAMRSYFASVRKAMDIAWKVDSEIKLPQQTVTECEKEEERQYRSDLRAIAQARMPVAVDQAEEGEERSKLIAVDQRLSPERRKSYNTSLWHGEEARSRAVSLRPHSAASTLQSSMDQEADRSVDRKSAISRCMTATPPMISPPSTTKQIRDEADEQQGQERGNNNPSKSNNLFFPKHEALLANGVSARELLYTSLPEEEEEEEEGSSSHDHGDETFRSNTPSSIASNDDEQNGEEEEEEPEADLPHAASVEIIPFPSATCTVSHMVNERARQLYGGGGGGAITSVFPSVSSPSPSPSHTTRRDNDEGGGNSNSNIPDQGATTAQEEKNPSNSVGRLRHLAALLRKLQGSTVTSQEHPGDVNNDNNDNKARQNFSGFARNRIILHSHEYIRNSQMPEIPTEDFYDVAGLHRDMARARRKKRAAAARQTRKDAEIRELKARLERELKAADKGMQRTADEESELGRSAAAHTTTSSREEYGEATSTVGGHQRSDDAGVGVGGSGSDAGVSSRRRPSSSPALLRTSTATRADSINNAALSKKVQSQLSFQPTVLAMDRKRDIQKTVSRDTTFRTPGDAVYAKVQSMSQLRNLSSGGGGGATTTTSAVAAFDQAATNVNMSSNYPSAWFEDLGSASAAWQGEGGEKSYAAITRPITVHKSKLQTQLGVEEEGFLQELEWFDSNSDTNNNNNNNERRSSVEVSLPTRSDDADLSGEEKDQRLQNHLQQESEGASPQQQQQQQQEGSNEQAVEQVKISDVAPQLSRFRKVAHRPRFAFIVSVSSYTDNRIVSDAQCDVDAFELVDILTEIGFICMHLHCKASDDKFRPTKENIFSRLKEFTKKIKTEDVLSLVIFLGGAYVGPLFNDGELAKQKPLPRNDNHRARYLLPSEVSLSCIREADVISPDDLAFVGNKSDMMNVVLCDTYSVLSIKPAVDCGGFFFAGGRPSIGSALTALYAPKQRLLGTYYLKRGLTGFATRDSRVTVNSLNSYVAAKLQSFGVAALETTASSFFIGDLDIAKVQELRYSRRDTKERKLLAHKNAAKITMTVVPLRNQDPGSPRFTDFLLRELLKSLNKDNIENPQLRCYSRVFRKNFHCFFRTTRPEMFLMDRVVSKNHVVKTQKQVEEALCDRGISYRVECRRNTPCGVIHVPSPLVQAAFLCRVSTFPHPSGKGYIGDVARSNFELSALRVNEIGIETSMSFLTTEYLARKLDRAMRVGTMHQHVAVTEFAVTLMHAEQTRKEKLAATIQALYRGVATRRGLSPLLQLEREQSAKRQVVASEHLTELASLSVLHLSGTRKLWEDLECECRWEIREWECDEASFIYRKMITAYEKLEVVERRRHEQQICLSLHLQFWGESFRRFVVENDQIRLRWFLKNNMALQAREAQKRHTMATEEEKGFYQLRSMYRR